MDSKIVWFQAVSSLHIGAGDSASVIDLPVVREKVTNWPFIPGSAIKGVFRDACGTAGARLAREAFGPDSAGGEDVDSAGSLWFADARLLCFPVRSLHGTFAWVTCPYALLRLSRDMAAADMPDIGDTPRPASDEAILLAKPSAVEDKGVVYLEDIDLNVADDGAGAIADSLAKQLFAEEWRSEFKQRFGIVSDNIFTFLVETCTEVGAHIRISDDKKTVANGALWYEESVPPETIFTMPLTASPRSGGSTPRDLMAILDEPLRAPFQIGGKAGVGRGIVRAGYLGKE